MNNKQIKGVLLILLSALMFSSYGVWSKLIGIDFGIFYQGWSRSLIIVIILFPLLLYKKEIVRIKNIDLKWLSVFLAFTSLTQVPLFYSFNHMDIGTATLIFFASMLITMYLFGFLFLNEKISKIKLSSLLMALVGLFYTFSFSWVSFTFLAAALAVLNGIASGGEVSSSKKISNTYSPLYITWLGWVIMVITHLPISFVLGEVQHIPSSSVR